MERSINKSAKQYIKQDAPFQLMIKRAHGNRQKRLMRLKIGHIINNFGQHLRSTQ